MTSDAQAGPVVGRLVFDGQCGFCTRSVHWLQRLDRHGRVDLQPYQAGGVPESVGADVAQCGDAVQWMGTDGVRRSGAEAINAVLDVVTGTGVPSRLYRSTAGLQERVYRWVAEHRSHLPGVTPHCQDHPEDCRH